jgi:hypothetical protein
MALDLALAAKEGWEGVELESKRALRLGSSPVKRERRGKMEDVGSLGSCREENSKGRAPLQTGEVRWVREKRRRGRWTAPYYIVVVP